MHAYGDVYLGGQPAAEDLQALAQRGVRSVINLRPEQELGALDERKLATELGLAYVNVPFGKPEELTDAVFAEALAQLGTLQKPLFLHCHSGNRVGAIWLAHRVLDDGVEVEAALSEAKLVGLKAPALESKARDYIERMRAAGR